MFFLLLRWFQHKNVHMYNKNENMKIECSNANAKCNSDMTDKVTNSKLIQTYACVQRCIFSIKSIVCFCLFVFSPLNSSLSGSNFVKKGIFRTLKWKEIQVSPWCVVVHTSVVYMAVRGFEPPDDQRGKVNPPWKAKKKKKAPTLQKLI